MQGRAPGKILAVIVFFILLFAFAKWGPAINFSTVSQTKGEPFLVSGEGKVYVTPDIAKITVGITDSGASLATVQNNVNQKSKALKDAIEKLGVKEGDIKTTSYNLYPQYDYNAPARTINGYQVSTSYEITIRDFDKINDVIVAGTAAGANMEGGVSFDINDETKNEKMNEARKLAVDDAKSKAQGLASAAGITLGKIINVSETQNPRNIVPMYGLGAAPSTEKSVTQPAVSPGQTELDVTVSLSYEVR
jgi:uncharacterized protein YggE